MNIQKKEIPILLSIKEASKEANLSEYTIRRLYLEGKIVGIRSGKKVFINVDKLIEYLNNSST